MLLGGGMYQLFWRWLREYFPDMSAAKFSAGQIEEGKSSNTPSAQAAMQEGLPKERSTELSKR